MAPSHAAFPKAVHLERLARARLALDSQGHAGCVSIAPEHHFYFAGYDAWVGVNSPQALLFSCQADDPILIVRDVDLPLARESSWVEQVWTYRLHRDSFAELVAEAARTLGIAEGSVATETQSYALPHALGEVLKTALAPLEIRDGTELLGALRVIKSAEELSYLRQAAGYAQAGLEAARRTLRPGITELALAAAVENAMRTAGSDYWAIPTELTAGPRSAGCHGTPRSRVIEAGELVHLEFAGVAQRYHAVAIQTLAAGQPDARAAVLYEEARRSLSAGLAAVKPGVPVAQVEAASLEPLRRAGLERYAMMRFGYGVGIAYPPIWLESLQISRDFATHLAPGMVFVLHACLELAEEKLGLLVGGTYALTNDGVEQLVGAGDVPLMVK